MLEGYIKIVRRLLPSPFSIAIILSIVTMVTVLFYCQFSNQETSFITVLGWWQGGLWSEGLLVFAVQMMLMLVLGHILALSPITRQLILKITQHATNSGKAAAIVALTTLVVGLFNWGLGLIFGAVLARSVGEFASKNQIRINYSLVGAAGYAALMIWHGGLSGSSLVKAAETGHIQNLAATAEIQLPSSIGLEETAFSTMNIYTSVLVIILLPITLYYVGKKSKASVPTLTQHNEQFSIKESQLIGAERVDHSPFFSKVIGISIFLYCLFIMFMNDDGLLTFFNPNNINLLLLGLALSAHSNIQSFLLALEEAIIGASGILIQFPLYFGIMGMMKESGLIQEISFAFISISNEFTFPIFSFLSAGIVNIFVPSGGGQWAIQGPIIIEAAAKIGVPLNKSILSLAYGDQITNMLQPFWALPLLGITKLTARDILPYTLVMFVVGFLVYLSGIILF